MKKQHVLFMSLVLVSAQIAVADEPEIEPTPVYENYDASQDPVNTAALGNDNIHDETDSFNGTKVGEITIHETDAGMQVYSGPLLVERIDLNSDGGVGRYTKTGSEIKFTPAGRPELNCPAQEISNWYGPCKVPEASS